MNYIKLQYGIRGKGSLQFIITSNEYNKCIYLKDLPMHFNKLIESDQIQLLPEVKIYNLMNSYFKKT